MPHNGPPSRSPSPTDPLHADSQRLHSTHHTLGYRDGLTAAKPTHVQSGFDESYPLGARIGLRIGWIHGVLASLPQTEEVVRARKEAEMELGEEKVWGKEWWEGEGVWKWEVKGRGENGEGVTLEDVVEEWPVWREWRGKVSRVAEGLGLQVRFTETEGVAGEEVGEKKGVDRA